MCSHPDWRQAPDSDHSTQWEKSRRLRGCRKVSFASTGIGYLNRPWSIEVYFSGSVLCFGDIVCSTILRRMHTYTHLCGLEILRHLRRQWILISETDFQSDSFKGFTILSFNPIKNHQSWKNQPRHEKQTNCFFLYSKPGSSTFSTTICSTPWFSFCLSSTENSQTKYLQDRMPTYSCALMSLSNFLDQLAPYACSCVFLSPTAWKGTPHKRSS